MAHTLSSSSLGILGGPAPKRGALGAGANIGGGMTAIYGLNKDGTYTVQRNDTGVSIAKAFGRPNPDVDWREMRNANPQTWGRPGEKCNPGPCWGWDINVNEVLQVPPSWLAAIGWEGTVTVPPGATVVTPGGAVTSGGGITIAGGTATPTTTATTQTQTQPGASTSTTTTSVTKAGLAGIPLWLYAAVAAAALGVVLLASRKGARKTPSRRSPRISKRTVVEYKRIGSSRTTRRMSK